MGNVICCLWFIPEGPTVLFQLSQSDSLSFDPLSHLSFMTYRPASEIISRHITHTKAEKDSITDCSECCSANRFLCLWLRHQAIIRSSLYLFCDFVSWPTVINASEYNEASVQGMFWLEKALHHPPVSICPQMERKPSIQLHWLVTQRVFQWSAFRVHNYILVFKDCVSFLLQGL